MIHLRSDNMEGKDIIYEFLDYIVYEKKYSEYTEKNYELDLFKYFDYLNKNNINYLKVKYSDITEFIENLTKSGYKSTTDNRILSSLRSFYNYLEINHKINYNPFKLVSSIKNPKRLPNYFKYNEFLTMISVIDDNILGVRNRLILEMLFSTGLRVGELSNVKINDIDIGNREIRILGKGKKERIVFYNEETQNVLFNYLENSRPCLLKNNDDGYLLLNHLGNKLTDRGIRLIVDEIVKKSCIKSKVSPHTFRHTFATILLNEGCNIKSVQELLGHSSLGTTGIYTHVTNDEMRSAYIKSHPRA